MWCFLLWTTSSEGKVVDEDWTLDIAGRRSVGMSSVRAMPLKPAWMLGQQHTKNPQMKNLVIRLSLEYSWVWWPWTRHTCVPSIEKIRPWLSEVSLVIEGQKQIHTRRTNVAIWTTAKQVYRFGQKRNDVGGRITSWLYCEHLEEKKTCSHGKLMGQKSYMTSETLTGFISLYKVTCATSDASQYLAATCLQRKKRENIMQALSTAQYITCL